MGIMDTDLTKKKDLKDYCRIMEVTDANGVKRELVFPKALDLDRPKRARTSFTAEQLFRLEHEFLKNQYLVGRERTDLSQRLGLSETQVKVWFQNRRTKHKRDKEKDPLEEDSTSCSKRMKEDSHDSAGLIGLNKIECSSNNLQALSTHAFEKTHSPRNRHEASSTMIRSQRLPTAYVDDSPCTSKLDENRKFSSASPSSEEDSPEKKDQQGSTFDFYQQSMGTKDTYTANTLFQQYPTSSSHSCPSLECLDCVLPGPSAIRNLDLPLATRFPWGIHQATALDYFGYHHRSPAKLHDFTLPLLTEQSTQHAAGLFANNLLPRFGYKGFPYMH